MGYSPCFLRGSGHLLGFSDGIGFNRSAGVMSAQDSKAARKAKTKAEFKLAVRFVNGTDPKHPRAPSNVVKVKYYAFYQQATKGRCTKAPPSLIFAPFERLKHAAWSRLGKMKKLTAMKKYIALLTEMEADWREQLDARDAAAPQSKL